MATKAQTKSATGKAPADPGVKVATVHACRCLTGTDETCDRTTQKVFAQGHDARMSSRLAQAIAKGEMTKEQATAVLKEAGAGEQLISKTMHSADLRMKPAGD